MAQKHRILVIGAHPDDCDLKAGGTAILSARNGHHVRFVSVTDGRSGHHLLPPQELILIRRGEAHAAAALLGVEYEVLDFPDGCLEPNLRARLTLLEQLRQFAPDLLLTHRPYDYHPDHRATSQLVIDAVSLLRRPQVLPEMAIPAREPVVGFLFDAFSKPVPFEAGIVVEISEVLETLVEALNCHRSQFYEWLPYNRCYEHEVPNGDAARREWLTQWFRQRIHPLCERFGQSREQHIEAFEISDYGRIVTLDQARQLFPACRIRR